MLHGGIYLRPAEVVNVTGKSVIAETNDGNMWEFMADSYKVGDRVILMMDDCGTPAIEDDIIVEVF